MTRVVFMCGPAGSGKSTYARTLEDQGLIRLSFDEEAWVRGIGAQPLSDDVQQEIERDLRARLVQLVGSGAEVVLDFSVWSRAMRDDYRAMLRSLGIEPETIYLRTPRDIALERIRARTGAHAGEVILPDDVAEAYFDHFQPPTVDEGPLTVIE